MTRLRDRFADAYRLANFAESVNPSYPRRFAAFLRRRFRGVDPLTPINTFQNQRSTVEDVFGAGLNSVPSRYVGGDNGRRIVRPEPGGDIVVNDPPNDDGDAGDNGNNDGGGGGGGGGPGGQESGPSGWSGYSLPSSYFTGSTAGYSGGDCPPGCAIITIEYKFGCFSDLPLVVPPGTAPVTGAACSGNSDDNIELVMRYFGIDLCEILATYNTGDTVACQGNPAEGPCPTKIIVICVDESNSPGLP